MFYELCYELIKSIILIIVLHHLFLYLKNLFLEVYEFNPQEIALGSIIKPVEIDNKKDANKAEIIDNEANNSKKHSTSDADIKDELLNFVNNEFNEFNDLADDELGTDFDNTLTDETSVFE